MSKVIQISLSDFNKLVSDAAKKEVKPIGVSRRKALQATGMTPRELRTAVQYDPSIKIRNNRYDLNKLTA